MTGRTGKALPNAEADPSLRIRSIAISFLIVAGSTIIGSVIGMGGALFVFTIAEGEGRGGVFVVAGFLIVAGAGLGLVAGAVYAAWRLHKQPAAIRTGKPYFHS